MNILKTALGFVYFVKRGKFRVFYQDGEVVRDPISSGLRS